MESELPRWLAELVQDVWEAPEWKAWNEVWKPRLEAHGVKPDTLQPIGDPNDQPA